MKDRKFSIDGREQALYMLSGRTYDNPCYLRNRQHTVYTCLHVRVILLFIGNVNARIEQHESPKIIRRKRGTAKSAYCEISISITKIKQNIYDLLRVSDQFVYERVVQ